MSDCGSFEFSIVSSTGIIFHIASVFPLNSGKTSKKLFLFFSDRVMILSKR